MKKRNKAILLIILSAFSFSFMFAFIRMSGDLPTMQKVFFRNFVALFFALGVMKKKKIGFRCKTKKNSYVLSKFYDVLVKENRPVGEQFLFEVLTNITKPHVIFIPHIVLANKIEVHHIHCFYRL